MERKQRMTEDELNALITATSAMEAEEVEAALNHATTGSRGAIQNLNDADYGEEMRYAIIKTALLLLRFYNLVAEDAADLGTYAAAIAALQNKTYQIVHDAGDADTKFTSDVYANSSGTPKKLATEEYVGTTGLFYRGELANADDLDSLTMVPGIYHKSGSVHPAHEPTDDQTDAYLIVFAGTGSTGGNTIKLLQYTNGKTFCRTVAYDWKRLDTQPATTQAAGIVKVGDNINATDGTISVPNATASTKGVVKPGTGLTANDGTISVNTDVIASKNYAQKLHVPVTTNGTTIIQDCVFTVIDGKPYLQYETT